MALSFKTKRLIVKAMRAGRKHGPALREAGLALGAASAFLPGLKKPAGRIGRLLYLGGAASDLLALLRGKGKGQKRRMPGGAGGAGGGSSAGATPKAERKLALQRARGERAARFKEMQGEAARARMRRLAGGAGGRPGGGRGGPRPPAPGEAAPEPAGGLSDAERKDLEKQFGKQGAADIERMMGKQGAAAPRKLPTEAGGGPAEHESIADAFAGMGKGISSNFYEGIFDALQKGKDTFAGVKDPVLVRAKPLYDAGYIKSAEDLQEFVQAGLMSAKTGNEANAVVDEVRKQRAARGSGKQDAAPSAPKPRGLPAEGLPETSSQPRQLPAGAGEQPEGTGEKESGFGGQGESGGERFDDLTEALDKLTEAVNKLTDVMSSREAGQGAAKKPGSDMGAVPAAATEARAVSADSDMGFARKLGGVLKIIEALA